MYFALATISSALQLVFWTFRMAIFPTLLDTASLKQAPPPPGTVTALVNYILLFSFVFKFSEATTQSALK